MNEDQLVEYILEKVPGTNIEFVPWFNGDNTHHIIVEFRPKGKILGHLDCEIGHSLENPGTDGKVRLKCNDYTPIKGVGVPEFHYTLPIGLRYGKIAAANGYSVDLYVRLYYKGWRSQMTQGIFEKINEKWEQIYIGSQNRRYKERKNAGLPHDGQFQLHYDDFEKSGPNGTHCPFYKGSKFGELGSRIFQDEICKHMKTDHRRWNRPLFKDDPDDDRFVWTLVYYTKGPSWIIEIGFNSSPIDCQKMIKYHDTLHVALLNATKKYIKTKRAKE